MTDTEAQLEAAKAYLAAIMGRPLPEMTPEFAFRAAETLAALMAQEAG